MSQSLKIALSAEWVGSQAGGLETYTTNLIKALAAQQCAHQFTAYTSFPDAFGDASQIRTRFLGTQSRLQTLTWRLPAALLKDRVDLLHATVTRPLWCPTKLVLTIHDLAYVLHPHWYPRAISFRLSTLTHFGTKTASRIIAASEYTKQTILERYRVNPDIIDVVYQGIHPRYTTASKATGPAQAAVQTLRKHGVTRPYILYVSRFHIRKNLLRLIKAFDAVKGDLDDAVTLVLCGRDQYHGALVTEEIEKRGLSARVICPGHVPDEDLPIFYQNALFFVYPSVFEGFGHPPLEAMSCGTAVLSSNLTSIPEVLGDAAYLVDPMDEDAIADGLLVLARDQNKRAQLAALGLERARRYSWDKTAAATITVYEKAANGG